MAEMRARLHIRTHYSDIESYFYVKDAQGRLLRDNELRAAMHTNLGHEHAVSSVLVEVLVLVLTSTGRTNDCIVVCRKCGRLPGCYQ